MGGENKGWPVGPVTDTQPGAVRFPTREEILADARRAKWRPIDTIPEDRTVLIGCFRKVAVQGLGIVQMWYMRHADPKVGAELVLFGTPATHWAEDEMGSPISGLANETANR